MKSLPGVTGVRLLVTPFLIFVQIVGNGIREFVRLHVCRGQKDDKEDRNGEKRRAKAGSAHLGRVSPRECQRRARGTRQLYQVLAVIMHERLIASKHAHISSSWSLTAP